MFLNSSQKTFTNSQLKKKGLNFINQICRKDRENRLKSQRYLNTITLIEYKVPYNKFIEKVQTTYNCYTLLNTIFQISQDINWRNYIFYMQTLISKFHNMISQNNASNIHDITLIPDFQRKFHNLFRLKDQRIYKHLIILLKLILAYNKKCTVLNQQKISQTLASISNYNNVQMISQILWILTQIQVSNEALIKLFKIQNLSLAIQKTNLCLLPFLTILANFLANNNTNSRIVQQLTSSNTFQKAFKLGINSTDINLINQSILIFNNGLCYSQKIRKIFLQSKPILKIILNCNFRQSQITKKILNFLGINIQQIFNQNNNNNFHENFNKFSIQSYKDNEFTFSASTQTAMNQ